MRDAKRRSPFLAGHRVVVLLTAAVVAVGLTGLTVTAAGADSGATAAKKKKKKKPCPPGTHKVIVKKEKNGKTIKKRKCVPNPTAPTPVPPAPTAALTISPTSFTYPEEHHGAVTHDQEFSVTNSGQAASGSLATSIGQTSGPPNGGFSIQADSCTGSVLAVNASCTVTVRLSYQNEGLYTATLHVVGAPGGDAQASLSGNST